VSVSAAPFAPGFDLLAPGSAQALVLVGARVSGLVLVGPVFSARTIPVNVRTAIVVLLTVLLQPVARAAAGALPILTPASIIGEVLIGFAIGLGAAVLVGAAEAAGEFLAIQIGLSGAAIVNPLDASQGPALGHFFQLFAIAILLAFDAHLVMLDSVAASLARIPIGGALDLRAGLASLVSLGTTLFVLGLRFAAPVVAAVLIANVALAVLSRAAPQLNVLSLAFPVQIGLGLFALAASIPFVAAWFTGWESTYDVILTRTLGAFAAGGVR
jgi:flagellar biosynthetic protein FliR